MEYTFDHRLVRRDWLGPGPVRQISIRARLARARTEAGEISVARRGDSDTFAEVGCLVFLHRDGAVLCSDVARRGNGALSCGDGRILWARSRQVLSVQPYPYMASAACLVFH